MLFLFRIGRKPVLLVISFILLAFFSSCSGNSENELRVLKSLNESLINSNLTLVRSSQTIYASLEDKLRDPITSQKATIWQPKAMVVKKYSSDLVNFIEGLKNKLKEEAGFKRVAGNESFNENDLTAVNTLFNEKGAGKELFARLKKFKQDILSIDIQMDSAFRPTLLLISKSFDTSISKEPDFTKIFFSNRPVVAALTMLSMFQTNINVIENRMITFCNTNKLSSTMRDFTTYSAIVGQNSSYVRGGEKIEITAGMGSFNTSSKPEIIVNGKDVAMNESGFAVYKFTASNKPGKHTLLVKIGYIDQDGKRQYIIKDVEYTVAKEN